MIQSSPACMCSIAGYHSPECCLVGNEREGVQWEAGLERDGDSAREQACQVSCHVVRARESKDAYEIAWTNEVSASPGG